MPKAPRKRKGDCRRYCSHGLCTTNTIDKVDGVKLLPFPKPCAEFIASLIDDSKEHTEKQCPQCSKCLRWIQLCKRSDGAGSNLNGLLDINNKTHICTKHFANGLGPTEVDPDPYPASVCEETRKSATTRRAPKLRSAPKSLIKKQRIPATEQALPMPEKPTQEIIQTDVLEKCWIKTEKVDTCDWEFNNEPDTDVSMANDPLSGQSSEQLKSTQEDQEEGNSLPSTVESVVCTPCLTNFPDFDCPEKQTVTTNPSSESFNAPISFVESQQQAAAKPAYSILPAIPEKRTFTERPLSADTLDCSSCLIKFPNTKSFVKHIVAANSKCFKNLCVPSKGKERSAHLLAKTGPEKQSVAESSLVAGQSFVCDSCFVNFPTKKSLTRHMAGFCFNSLFPQRKAVKGRASGGRGKVPGDTFNCRLCKMKFKDISELERHVVNHPKEGCFKIKCTFCNKIFSHVSTRNQHLLMHTGEKKYECDFCPKVFRQCSDRNRHLRTHTGEKSYECNVCLKLFSQSGDRNRHLRTHKGKKRWMKISS